MAKIVGKGAGEMIEKTSKAQRIAYPNNPAMAAARARVREVIRKDEMRGVEIQLHVRKWAERCGR